MVPAPVLQGNDASSRVALHSAIFTNMEFTNLLSPPARHKMRDPSIHTNQALPMREDVDSLKVYRNLLQKDSGPLI